MSHLNTWLTEKLIYPDIAVDHKTTGDVVTQFVIDRSGAVTDVQILKDIGDGCGAAAAAALKKMPDWIPGRQGGVPVNVRFTIPVRFDLK